MDERMEGREGKGEGERKEEEEKKGKGKKEKATQVPTTMLSCVEM